MRNDSPIEVYDDPCPANLPHYIVQPPKERASWQSLVTEKQAEREGKITFKLPKEMSERVDRGGSKDVTGIPALLLTPAELAITDEDVSTLLRHLARGAVSSVEVVSAFCKRACVAQQTVNCLTEIMFADGLARARELDEHLRKNGKPIGPLHGLPISIKDVFPIKGHDTTSGFAAWIRQPSNQNAVIVDTLLRLGAVLYTKTTAPPGSASDHTLSNVFGSTCNPYNRTLTAGGSSGGEASLISMRGSPLGIGTDIGGSVRTPAAKCGLFGLRPTASRLPLAGYKLPYVGFAALQDSMGPMCHSIDGIEIFMRAILGDKAARVADPGMLAIPYREVKLPAQLTFGVMPDNVSVGPDPATQRALAMTVSALEAAGHRVVRFPVDAAMWKAFPDMFASTFIDIRQSVRSLLLSAGEPVPIGVARRLDGQATRITGLSHEEMWALRRTAQQLQQRFAALWQMTAENDRGGRPIDAWVGPVSALCHEPLFQPLGEQAYTCAFNLLDYPAMSIPVTRVDPALDRAWSGGPRNDMEEQARRLCGSKLPRLRLPLSMYLTDDAELFAGCPVAVQLVAQTLEDEKLIEMTKVVVQALRI